MGQQMNEKEANYLEFKLFYYPEVIIRNYMT